MPRITTPFTMLAFSRLLLLAVYVLTFLPVLFLVRLLLPWFWWVLPPVFHRGVCKIMGIRITVIGTPAPNDSVLFISNHISWKDIIILGSVIKKASFIAKSEVGSIGLVRMIVNLQKTIYVRRERRSEAKKQSEEMAGRIHAGDNLILFPEGTTTRGVHVNSFKSTLFAVAEMIIRGGEETVTVQPLTLSYTHANNLPILRSQRIRVGWIGDEDFWPHFRYALNRRSTYVTVDFHDPITNDHTINRKKLAAECEAIIREGLSKSHRKK